MSQHTNVYKRVLTISEDYLGPAAPRFLSRLVTNHLSKPASQITVEDLPQLVIWIRLAATVITDDELVVNDYIERLEKLGSQPRAKGLGDTSNHHVAPA
jgi:hypothetical protein